MNDRDFIAYLDEKKQYNYRSLTDLLYESKQLEG